MKTVAVAVVIAVAGCASRPPKTYEVTYLPDARITVDGRPEEEAWQEAALEDGFVFPWRGRDTVAPRTAFRALCDDRFLYFVFVVEDADVVVDAATEGEMALIAEDRVEFYFAPDLELEEYYCVEMDFTGRRLDYRAVFHRQFDFSWEFAGLETAGTRTDTGYIVEGALALSVLAALGLPSLDSGRLRVGMYRAEFSHGEGPAPRENWISWIDPHTTEEDFHIPGTLGVFQRIE